MEFFSNLSLISLAIVLLTSLFSFFVFRRRNGNVDKLPPGSFGWPFIGESMAFLFGKPENFMAHRMKKYSPDIFKTKILGEKTAVICGPNGHKFLFSNEDTYFTSFRPHSMQKLFRSYKTTNSTPSPSPPPSSSSSLREINGPQNNDSKPIRQPGFLKPEALSTFLVKMESMSAQLLESHCRQGIDDVVEVYPLANTVALTLACQFFMGSNNPERTARLVDYFHDITLGMHSIISYIPGTVFYRANKAASEIRKELLDVIKEKKETMASTGATLTMDILSAFIGMTDSTGKPWPENVVADRIMGMLVGGYSTVGSTITFLMKHVGENQQVYDKIRTEQMKIADSKKDGEGLQWEDMHKMKYSWNVIMETLRLNPPLQGTFREVLNDFTYAGYTVPKGWKVYWTVSSTNMNPTYFKNPERFDPSRFDYEQGEYLAPYTYVPFGGGPRLCPGKEYARLAILSFIHIAVKKYKWEVLFPDEKVIDGMVPVPEKGLPIRLHRL